LEAIEEESEYIIASKGRAVAAEANERLRHKHILTLYPTFIPFPFFLDCYKPELRALIIHSLNLETMKTRREQLQAFEYT